MNYITSKEIAQQFAIAFELLVDWFEQKRSIQKETQEIKLTGMDRLLNMGEVGKILGISRAHAYNLVDLATRLSRDINRQSRSHHPVPDCHGWLSGFVVLRVILYKRLIMIGNNSVVKY